MASTQEWNKFFLEAKVPKDAAARYAVTFNRNRISFDMMLDLDKVSSEHVEYIVFDSSNMLIHFPGLFARHGYNGSRRCH